MYFLTKIGCQELALPGGGWFDFNCDERVNLFVGPNASGKSTILRAIMRLYSLALSEPLPRLYEPNVYTKEDGTLFFEEINHKGVYTLGDGSTTYEDEINYSTPGGGLSFSMKPNDDWPRDETGGARWSEVPFLYIPATRTTLPTQRVFEPYIFDQIAEEPEVLETNAILKRLFDTESGIFDGRYVELAIDMLLKEMTEDIAKQDQLRWELQNALSCVQRICSEVISDDSPRPYVDKYEVSGMRRSVHRGMGIGTTDNLWNAEQPLYAGALSSGTQGTLLWVYALVLKMIDHYRLSGDSWFTDLRDKPAILLIDEIENHLHPTWQRRVIPALLHYFPGLQIFATTHSPFVVAGLKAGQVHLLKRDDPASTYEQDIVGWTADEILRNLMGVDDPTDQLTVDRMSRLRRLREKESLTAEEDAELNDLRRQVNEDLLSRGGPLEAQRDRYDELIKQFIHSRQSELTQDGD